MPVPSLPARLPRPPKAVTLDCWSTLLIDRDFAGALRHRGASLAGIANRLGRNLSVEEGIALIERAWALHVDQWRRGCLFGPEGAAEWCLGEIGITGDPAAVDELAECIANGTLQVGTAAVEGAADALVALRQAGIPTALVCDTGFTPARVVRAALRANHLSLDHYFFSDEVGVPKPDPAIFRAALQASGADAGDAVHIGDLRRTDVAGARATGMASIRFAGVHDDGWMPEDCNVAVEADAVLHSWADLGPLLGLAG